MENNSSDHSLLKLTDGKSINAFCICKIKAYMRFSHTVYQIIFNQKKSKVFLPVRQLFLNNRLFLSDENEPRQWRMRSLEVEINSCEPVK